jgi:hypothetical protein
MRRLPFLLALLALFACAWVDKHDQPAPPSKEYPCGPANVVCSPSPLACCAQDHICGGPFPIIGCLDDSCCFEPEVFGAARGDGGARQLVVTGKKWAPR